MTDSRFGAFVENFGTMVLLEEPGRGRSGATELPDFDDTLRQAFRRETELFFESIVREDRSALDLPGPTTRS